MEDQHTRRIETPAHIAQGPDGEPGYIILKTRFKNKYLLAFSRMVDLGNALNRAIESEAEGMTQADAQALADAYREAVKINWETFATLVLEWNWIDDETGQPLPQPAGNTKVFQEELYPEQTGWLREQFQEAQKYRSTEGNGRSGSDS